VLQVTVAEVAEVDDETEEMAGAAVEPAGSNPNWTTARSS
jgi:hypothetical protein